MALAASVGRIVPGHDFGGGTPLRVVGPGVIRRRDGSEAIPTLAAAPAAVDAWQKLDSQLATIDAIGRIAAQFGCRTARFPLIEEYTLGDGFRLHDAAIWCCDGPNLVVDL